jgi:hypothetical protein
MNFNKLSIAPQKKKTKQKWIDNQRNQNCKKKRALNLRTQKVIISQHQRDYTSKK